MRRAALALALLLALLAAGRAGAATPCEPATWFDLENVTVECPVSGGGTATVSIPFAESYISSIPPQGGSDPGLERLELLQEKQEEIFLSLQPLAADLDDPIASDVRMNRGEINAKVSVEHGMVSLRLVLPVESLLCNGEPVDEEIPVDIQPIGDNGENPLASCTAGDREASRPLDWRIDLAPADDDAENDSGLAVEFEIEKDWGYNFHLDLDRQRWSTNLWRLRVTGSGVTNEADFYDAVKADFSWSYNRTYVAAAVARQPFTALWAGAYVRPESTFDGDDRDYVYGARVEVLANLRKLIGTDMGTGARPYLSLGIEQVDPAQREDGSSPDNYGRLAGELLWNFAPLERVRVEASWQAKYLLSEDDVAALGLDGRLQDKLAVSVAYDATGSGEFLPFLKITRGTDAPRFELVDEVLFGFAWNRLFPGERP